MNKILFLSGCTGQLGAFLAKLYLEKGYTVIGGARRSANWNPWRLKYFNILDKISIEHFDLADQSSIDRVVEKYKPELFINAAAQSFVGSSWDIGAYTLDVTGVGVYRCLDAIRKYSPHTRFLQMSSSEMFGSNPNYPYNEKSVFMPRSPYGVAKCAGFYTTCNFRESYGIFASNLISFNFESSLRGIEFLPKKVVKEAVRIHNEIQCGLHIKPLQLGNLAPSRDWIWAGDTAHAVELILDHDKPDDFCVASGVTTTVKEFCNKVFSQFGYNLKWETVQYPINQKPEDLIERATTNDGILVESLSSLHRPADVPHLIGDASKATKELGWLPTKNLDQIIKEMIDFEYED